MNVSGFSFFEGLYLRPGFMQRDVSEAAFRDVGHDRLKTFLIFDLTVRENRV